MLKYILIAGGVYYYMNKQLQAALADRQALMSMLTPAQQQQILSGLQAATRAAAGAVNATAAALLTAAQTPASVPIPTNPAINQTPAGVVNPPPQTLQGW